MGIVLSGPEDRPRRTLLTATAVLVCFVTLLIVAERDFTSVVFAFACFGLIACIVFALCSRVTFALTLALSFMVASAGISRVKFKFMAINAHVFDLYFFFKNTDTLLYLLNDFWKVGLGALLGLGCLVGILIFVF